MGCWMKGSQSKAVVPDIVARWFCRSASGAMGLVVAAAYRGRAAPTGAAISRGLVGAPLLARWVNGSSGLSRQSRSYGLFLPS